MREGEESEFTVLENKTIGRNFYMFRKLRDRKALEVAEFLGIKEATYTKYERGESKITVDLIQKVAEYLNVDPLHLISAQPGHVIEHLTNSPVSINSSNNHTIINDKQTEVMMKMMETMMQMNEAIRKILEKE
ncbi:helix-turn-helix domain-containing protein [Algoriphagus pacificus]|uniref:Helix-turn-helix transcriptional regulator n=1 Tax=Algoriphagus pacificus TaxID=2811234 RepID=A0ABS3CIP1_9BACT|nr:helix-turn-helix transcriptional regulator [Algoriphagus pacificus]MBN7816917.1 helix-turn-helix transcriptional regulator [Algoriphagus pacificus]